MEYKDITLKTLLVNRPDLVQAVKNGEDEPTPEVSVTKDAKGRRKVWTEVTRDIDGKQVSKRVDTYSYYATGEINTIKQVRYGVSDLKAESENEIKHYTDGRQPVVKKIISKVIIK